MTSQGKIVGPIPEPVELPDSTPTNPPGEFLRALAETDTGQGRIRDSQGKQTPTRWPGYPYRPVGYLPAKQKCPRRATTSVRAFAYVQLGLGIIGAFLIWAVFGATGGRSGALELNLVGIISGMGILAWSIFAFAFLLMLCSMTEQLADIRDIVIGNE